MVMKALSNMKSGKAAGSSGIVVEMIKAAGEHSWIMICDLSNTIIRDGIVRNDVLPHPAFFDLQPPQLLMQIFVLDYD